MKRVSKLEAESYRCGDGMYKDDEKTEKLKKLLYGYTYIEFEIESINEKIINLGEVISSQRDIRIPELSTLPCGNEISDTVYNSVEKIVDTYGHEVAKLESRLEKAFRKRNYINDLISILDPIEKRIIELKYFKKYKVWMICSSISYERSNYYRLHDKAFEKLLEAIK
jgi:DNA-directed RNA polymerase specialized sigma subunit